MTSKLRFYGVCSTILLSCFGYSSSVQAKTLFIEPYAGYGLNTMSAKIGGNQMDLSTSKGFGVGGRLGIRFLKRAFLAGDFSYFPSADATLASGVSTITIGSSNFGTSGNKVTRMGAVLGLDVPVVPLRLWAGYNLLDNLSDSSMTLSGRSFKGGVGLTFIPLVSLNVEYILTNYSSVTMGGVSQKIDPSASVTSKMLLFSASVPLNLF